MSALRAVLDPWLGVPRWKQTEGRVTFSYRFSSEGVPPIPLRLKVETDTREHFAVLGFQKAPFAVKSRWFEGHCETPTYGFDELLAAKLRALYPRKRVATSSISQQRSNPARRDRKRSFTPSASIWSMAGAP